MDSVMSSETAEFFKRFIKDNQPYPITVLDDLMFDDNRFDEKRLDATFALECLLKAGFTEEEVNPWKE